MMTTKNWPVMLLALSALFIIFGYKQYTPSKPSTVPMFRLESVTGKQIGFADFPVAKGFIVVFTCNHCPFAKLYSKRYNNLNTEFAPKGVPLLAINPMDTLVYEEEGMTKMKEFANQNHFNFPYLADFSQVVAKSFKATRTPEAYIIWKENGNYAIKYAGAIDDNGKYPEKANPLLANAVRALLAGKKIRNPETASIGCTINYNN